MPKEASTVEHPEQFTYVLQSMTDLKSNAAQCPDSSRKTDGQCILACGTHDGAQGASDERKCKCASGNVEAEESASAMEANRREVGRPHDCHRPARKRVGLAAKFLLATFGSGLAPSTRQTGSWSTRRSSNTSSTSGSPRNEGPSQASSDCLRYSKEVYCCTEAAGGT